MTLYLLDYNNYYNRKLKVLETIVDYESYVISAVQNCNFNPGDDVNTIARVNIPEHLRPNYVILTDNENKIVSRWFIIESTFVCGGQYNLTLRRDLIADHFKELKDAPMFIEKATLNPNDPLIFNNEDMTFNQIKQNEWYLRDKTDSAWIVGYYDKTRTDGYEVELSNDISYDTAVAEPYLSWIQENQIRTTITETKYIVNARTGPSTSYTNWKYTVYGKQGFAERTEITGLQSLNSRTDVLPQQLYEVFANKGFSTLDDLAKTYSVGSASTQQELNELLNYSNKIVRFPNEDGTGFDYYRITISTSTYNDSIYSVTAGSLYNEMNSIALQLFNDSDSVADSNSFKVSFSGSTYTVSAEKIITGSFKVRFDIGQYALDDAPYGMFAIPYPINSANLGDMIIKNTGNAVSSITVNKEVGYRIAAALSKKYSTGAESGPIYDIQLLPYCPVQSIIQADGSLDLNNDNLLYVPIEKLDSEAQTESWASVILFASRSSFSLDIPFTNINLGDYKIGSQTVMCRLASPNYNGQFEFNPYKNNGISRINVDCTYKPFQPYIHLNPDFKGLYGNDYNDSRGLICGGDFSLPRITDAWESYQLQNKNFQEIFDRQITNMEINNKYQKVNDIVASISGTISGATSGAFIGSQLGNAGMGAAIGGTLSAAAGITDVIINEKLRNEAIDYTKDQFGYQLGNIQAMPQSISKTTAFTYNNKIYPIIEFYSCTDREIEALANKIVYNGMTVMAIGTLSDYIDNTWSFTKNDGSIITAKNYFKAQLIQANIEGEFHILKEIANELNKGIYLEE